MLNGVAVTMKIQLLIFCVFALNFSNAGTISPKSEVPRNLINYSRPPELLLKDIPVQRGNLPRYDPVSNKQPTQYRQYPNVFNDPRITPQQKLPQSYLTERSRNNPQILPNQGNIPNINRATFFDTLAVPQYNYPKYQVDSQNRDVRIVERNKMPIKPIPDINGPVPAKQIYSNNRRVNSPKETAKLIRAPEANIEHFFPQIPPRPLKHSSPDSKIILLNRHVQEIPKKHESSRMQYQREPLITSHLINRYLGRASNPIEKTPSPVQNNFSIKDIVNRARLQYPSNSPQQQGKHYLVVYPNGTVGQIDGLQGLTKKYPNYILVNAQYPMGRPMSTIKYLKQNSQYGPLKTNSKANVPNNPNIRVEQSSFSPINNKNFLKPASQQIVDIQINNKSLIVEPETNISNLPSVPNHIKKPLEPNVAVSVHSISSQNPVEILPENHDDTDTIDHLNDGSSNLEDKILKPANYSEDNEQIDFDSIAKTNAPVNKVLSEPELDNSNTLNPKETPNVVEGINLLNEEPLKKESFENDEKVHNNVVSLPDAIDTHPEIPKKNKLSEYDDVISDISSTIPHEVTDSTVPEDAIASDKILETKESPDKILKPQNIVYDENEDIESTLPSDPHLSAPNMEVGATSSYNKGPDNDNSIIRHHEIETGHPPVEESDIEPADAIANTLSNDVLDPQALAAIPPKYDEKRSPQNSIEPSINNDNHAPIWFSTSDPDFWEKVTDYNEDNVVYLFQVHNFPKVENDKTKTVLSNGTVIEEITKVVWENDRDEPTVTKSTLVLHPNDDLNTGKVDEIA